LRQIFNEERMNRYGREARHEEYYPYRNEVAPISKLKVFGQHSMYWKV